MADELDSLAERALARQTHEATSAAAAAERHRITTDEVVARVNKLTRQLIARWDPRTHRSLTQTGFVGAPVAIEISWKRFPRQRTVYAPALIDNPALTLLTFRTEEYPNERGPSSFRVLYLDRDGNWYRDVNSGRPRQLMGMSDRCHAVLTVGSYRLVSRATSPDGTLEPWAGRHDQHALTVCAARVIATLPSDYVAVLPAPLVIGLTSGQKQYERVLWQGEDGMSMSTADFDAHIGALANKLV